MDGEMNDKRQRWIVKLRIKKSTYTTDKLERELNVPMYAQDALTATALAAADVAENMPLWEITEVTKVEDDE